MGFAVHLLHKHSQTPALGHRSKRCVILHKAAQRKASGLCYYVRLQYDSQLQRL